MFLDDIADEDDLLPRKLSRKMFQGRWTLTVLKGISTIGLVMKIDGGEVVVDEA
jgi:hypothetical protein